MEKNKKQDKFGRRSFLKLAAVGGLVAALGTGGLCYLASDKKQEISSEVRRALASGTECLYESDIEPRGIVLHRNEDRSPYFTYVVAVPEKDLGEEVQKQIEEIQGKRNPSEYIDKSRFELRKLEHGKEKTIKIMQQFASGERAVSNSDVNLGNLRYDRYLVNNNGNPSYGLLETDVLTGKTNKRYIDDRNHEIALGFRPIGADKRIWVAGFDNMTFDKASREYMVGLRNAKKQLTRKDVLEASVPMMSDLDRYIAILGEELKKKGADENIVNDAKKIIRGEIEQGYSHFEARTKIGLPQYYHVIGIAGNNLYFSNYLKKPIDKYVIGKANLAGGNK